MSIQTTGFNGGFKAFCNRQDFRTEQPRNGKQQAQELSCLNVELDDELQISPQALLAYSRDHELKVVNDCVDPSKIKKIALLNYSDMYPVIPSTISDKPFAAKLVKCIDAKTISKTKYDQNKARDYSISGPVWRKITNSGIVQCLDWKIISEGQLHIDFVKYYTEVINNTNCYTIDRVSTFGYTNPKRTEQ